VTTILVVIIGCLFLWTVRRSALKPYRWAWVFFVGQGVCAFVEWVAGFKLTILWVALCIASAVFACLGYITEYIDKAIISLQSGKSRSGGQESLDHLEMSEGSGNHPEELELDLSTQELKEHYYVTPSTNTYRRRTGWNGHCLYKYTVKGQQVFSRLVDKSHGISGDEHHEVVNGQIIEDEVRRPIFNEWCNVPADADILFFNPQSYTPEAHAETIAQYKKETQWNEVHGSLRFFILSKHSPRFCPVRERARLRKGFAEVDEALSPLGLTRIDMVDWLYGIQAMYCWRPKDADLQTTQALNELRSGLGIGFLELRDYEQIIKTLDKLIAADERLVALAAEYENRPTVSPWEIKMEADRRIGLDKRRAAGLPVDESYQPKWLRKALKEYEKATP